MTLSVDQENYALCAIKRGIPLDKISAALQCPESDIVKVRPYHSEVTGNLQEMNRRFGELIRDKKFEDYKLTPCHRMRAPTYVSCLNEINLYRSTANYGERHV